VPQDDKESASWFNKSAAQGNALAQFNLGVMYIKGQGVPQDYTMALKWYMKAAEQNNPLAQFDLGVMYTNGEGTEVDMVQAYKWFSLASRGGGRRSHEKKEPAGRKDDPQGNRGSAGFGAGLAGKTQITCYALTRTFRITVG